MAQTKTPAPRFTRDYAPCSKCGAPAKVAQLLASIDCPVICIDCVMRKGYSAHAGHAEGGGQ